MPSLETIRRITIRGTTEGVDQATASLNKLAAAQGNVAVVSDQSAKRALSAEAAYKKQTLAIDDQARAQANIAKATKTADAALAQGIITQDEHAKRVQQINQHYGNLTRSQAAVGTAIGDLNARLAAATGAAGSLGSILTTLGPIGIGVAAVLGTAVLALKAMSDASHALAEKAQELKRFAEVTGLTTQQVQALRSEASKFGLTSDEAQTAIQNFTARFNDLRIGQGELLTQVRRLNPALADQMASVTNAGDALTLFGRALAGVDDVFQRNALVKAATGRGGIAAAGFLTNINVDALTKSFTDAGKGLDEGLIKKLAQLEIEIKKTEAQAKQAFASIFAQDVLQGELAFAKSWLDFATSVKNFSISGDLRYLLETVLKIKLGGAGTLLGWMGIDYEGGYKSPSLVNPQRKSAPEILVPTYNTGAGAADNTGGSRSQLAPTQQYVLETLQKQIAAMGDAATFAQKLDAAQKQLAISGKEAGLSAEQMAKAEEALKLSFGLQQLQALLGILGPAATVQQQYAARVQQIAKAQMEGAGATDAQIANAKRLAMAQADGTFALQAQIDATRIQTATIGMTVAKAEEYRIVQTKIAENLNAGKPALDGVTQAYRDQARAAAEARAAQDLKNIADQAQFELDTALLSSTEKRIAALKKQYGDNDQTGAIADQMRMTDAIKQGQDAAVQFSTTLADGLLDGKNSVDTLKSAFDGLAKSMANAAIKDLFSGNFEKAGIEAVIAIGAKLAGNFFDNSQQKALDEAKKKWNDMTEQLQSFIATANGFDMSGPAAALRQLFDSAVDLAKAANAAGDMTGLAKVVQGFVTGMSRIIDEFANPAIGISDSAQQIKAANDNAKGLTQTLVDIGQLSQGAADAINSGLLKRIQSIREDLSKSLNADINEAQGKGFINSVNEIVAKQKQLLNEANAPAELIQTWFETQLQKVADGLNNDEFKEFQKAFPSLTQNVKQSTDAIKDLQDQLNTTARSIVDYVNQFYGGPSSILSPGAQLNAAQSTYNTQFALAQGGNLDAQKTITQYADAFIKALQLNFGAGGASAQVNQVLGQLLSLPAVQQTTDPVVQALRDNLTAINAVATAVGLNTDKVVIDTNTMSPLEVAIQANTANTKAATDLVKVSTDAVKGAVDALNNIAVSMNTFTSRIVAAINEHGAMSAIAFTSMDQNLARIRSGTDWMAVHNAGSGLLAGGFAVSTAGSTPVNYTSRATGGWIFGGTPGVDSVPVMAMPDEFVIRRDVARANADWLPSFNQTGRVPGNDNSEIRALRREVADLRTDLVRALGRVARATEDGASHVRKGVDGLHDQGEEWRADDKRNWPRQVARR